MMKISEAIARWCEEIETPFVSGIPGNGILEVIDDLHNHTRVPWVLPRHEQGASMMASSYAFHTRKPAVVMSLKAPGSTNLSIGVMGAFVESLPMIVLSVQVHNRFEGYEAFEEINLSKFFEAITKWSVQVNNPERTMELLNEAYRKSVSGRPGPVHVAIPYNFMNYEIERFASPRDPRTPREINLSALGIEEVLRNAKRPLIIAGGGLPFENVEDVLAISRLIDAPIVKSWMRKTIPDRDEYCLGMAGIGGSPAAQYAIENADAVLVFGSRFSQQMTEHFRMRFNENAKLIHVDLDPGVIGRVYEVEIGILADLRTAVPSIRNLLERSDMGDRKERRSWRVDLQSRQERYMTEVKSYKRDKEEIQGRYAVELLREKLPADATIVLDSGNFLHWAEQYFPIERPGFFHYPTSGSMGYGVPGAIGAKFAHPDRLVCALVGDGGFAMTMSELETSVRENKPILVIIINNNTLGHIRARQDAKFGGRRIGVNFGTQKFHHIAEIFGIHGVRVDRLQDLDGALDEAIRQVHGGTSAVVDIQVSDEMAMAANVNWWPA